MLKPWEEIGVDVSAFGDLAEAMQEANVLFNVSVRQGFFETGRVGNCRSSTAADGHFYIVRDDIPAVLGACKGKFQPLQNADAFSFFVPMLEDGSAILDTIGGFDLGAKTWILAKLTGKKYTVVDGDEVEMYIILVNSHDGSSSVMAGLVPIRVWCSNMFSMLNKEDYEIVKFKHTGDIAGKLKAVRGCIEKQLQSACAFMGGLRGMAEYIITPEELDEYFRTVFKVKPEGEASTKSENKIKRLKELFIFGKGNDIPNVRGTWYAAYNAATEYLNYEAGRNSNSRLRSLWFGANKNTNKAAYEVAVNMKDS